VRGDAGDAGSRARHHLLWAAASQGVNAGTNIAVTLQLARLLPARHFATLAIGLAVLPLTVACLRGMDFEPAVVHGDLSRSSAWRMLRHAAVGGFGAAACLVAAVAALDGPLAIGLLLAVGAVATTVQDGSRWLLFGLQEPRRAATLDLVWAVVQMGAMALALGSPTVAALAWSLGAVASAVVGTIAVRRSTEVRPSPPLPRVWQWGLEYVVAAGAPQLALLVAPLTGGVEVAGGLRGALSLLGGATVLLGGAQQAVAARVRRVDDDAELRRLGVRMGIGLGLVVAVACAPLLALGDHLGTALLGESWPATRVVLPILVLQRIATAVACGPAFALRRRLDHTSGLWWRVGLTSVALAFVLVAAEVGSSRGAAWALTVAAVVSVPVWMRMLPRATPGPQPAPRPFDEEALLDVGALVDLPALPS